MTAASPPPGTPDAASRPALEVPPDGAAMLRTGCDGGVLVIAFAPGVDPERIVKVAHDTHEASGLKVIAVADVAAVRSWHPHDDAPAPAALAVTVDATLITSGDCCRVTSAAKCSCGDGCRCACGHCRCTRELTPADSLAAEFDAAADAFESDISDVYSDPLDIGCRDTLRDCARMVRERLAPAWGALAAERDRLAIADADLRHRLDDLASQWEHSGCTCDADRARELREALGGAPDGR